MLSIYLYLSSLSQTCQKKGLSEFNPHALSAQHFIKRCERNMLGIRRVGLRCTTRLLRREFAAPASPAGGIGLKTAVAGMVGTAGLGIGIGMLLPSVLFGDKEKSKDLQQQGRPQDSRRKSTVYESASVIAEEIKRPAMVVDASRAEVEALYEFKSCLASGGTGSVWRAVDRRTGEAVAIKVIDKKKLNPALFNMEVSPQR